ncbi:MAG: diguanylate cyclase [Lachnospiraceae bacterium]|nr:diguanylate cyclase [Lachnospiraceae bacterium]
MKQTSSIPIRTCLAVYFVFLVLFLGHAFFFTDMQSFVHAGRAAAERDYMSDWTVEGVGTADLHDISAGKCGGNLSLSKTLPAVMEETDVVYFSTSNLRLTVYVDDTEVYSFDTRENMTGTGDGVSYHMIGLGPKDQGKTLRIEAETVFADGHGGRINEMQYGPEELYRYYTMSHNFAAVMLSFLMLIFGEVVIVFYFGLSRKNPMMRSLWALGLSSILFGLWSLCDTGIPQLLTGCTYASREIVYGILHLAGFPMIWFVNRVTALKQRIWVYLSFTASIACFGCLVILRYSFGRDMHTMVPLVYFSYAVQLLLLVAMLINNELYCRRKQISSRLRFFYFGATVFVVCCFVDMFRYQIGQKGSLGHGSWFRFGLVTFFILMAFQIFDWWATEKSSLERDRFINRLLQYVTEADDPEIRIGKVMEYLCTELHADRAYIFEEMPDKTFDNTYEYCAEGVTPQIDNLKGLPYEGVVDVWYNEYKKGGHILIYDLEKYRAVSKEMYEVLKPQGIRTLVTGPLILEGKYIGFFGVDNPPEETMKEISEIIRLLMYFLSEMLGQRNDHRRLIEYSFHDALTGTGNRRAISEFENEKLDTTRPYGFIMCDINGLKAVNDQEGHKAGDALIRTVASCLTDVFGTENVYRMGGDEFAVYSCEDSKEEFERKIGRVRELLAAEHTHVAIGYSYAEAGDADFNARRIEADNRMYDEKRRFHRDGE